jgi:hypothetical protein
MFIGALAGAVLVINVDLVIPLSIAAVVIAANALAAHRLSTEGSDWAQPPRRTGSSASREVSGAAPGP